MIAPMGNTVKLLTRHSALALGNGFVGNFQLPIGWSL